MSPPCPPPNRSDRSLRDAFAQLCQQAPQSKCWHRNSSWPAVFKVNVCTSTALAVLIILLRNLFKHFNAPDQAEVAEVKWFVLASFKITGNSGTSRIISSVSYVYGIFQFSSKCSYNISEENKFIHLLIVEITKINPIESNGKKRVMFF